jgi:hypothetical protein
MPPPRCLPAAQSARIRAERLKLSNLGSLEPDNSDTFMASPLKDEIPSKVRDRESPNFVQRDRMPDSRFARKPISAFLRPTRYQKWRLPPTSSIQLASGRRETIFGRCRRERLTVSFFAPGRPVFHGPVKQGAFKTYVVASFLALVPSVTKDLLAFG